MIGAKAFHGTLNEDGREHALFVTTVDETMYGTIHSGHQCYASLLVLGKQLLDSIHLVFRSLLLVRPAAHAYVGLDAYNTVRVQHTVALSDDLHACIP